MIKLISYDSSYEPVTLRHMTAFFGFHRLLVPPSAEEAPVSGADGEEIRSTLAEWLIYPSVLYVIVCEDTTAGFIRIQYRGPEVAWIEDIFVDSSFRGRGIASAAIAAAEALVRDAPGYTAVCLDVSPRNETALRLYHKLGYTDLSLITVRKELDGGKRDRTVTLFGADYQY